MESMNQRLLRLRKKRGLTLKQMAQEIGVPTSTYRDWEYNETLRGNYYMKISKVLKVSLYELITGEKPNNQRVLQILEEVENKINLARSELVPQV